MHFSLLLLLSPQSCLTLCNPIDGSPPGSPIPGILQARTLEWVAISFSNACMKVKSESESENEVVSDPQQPHGLQPTRLLLPWEFPGKSTGVGCQRLLRKSLELCPNLCSPMDHSLPDSSFHGILQAKILEWAAISYARESSQPRN